MTVTGIRREKSLPQLPLCQTNASRFRHDGECRQGRKYLTSLSSTYVAYSGDPGFKSCPRDVHREGLRDFL